MRHLRLVPPIQQKTLSARRLTLGAISPLTVSIVASLALNVHCLRVALFGRKPPGQIGSLAVLPLENLSRDPEQDYFAMGMTDAHHRSCEGRAVPCDFANISHAIQGYKEAASDRRAGTGR